VNREYVTDFWKIKFTIDDSRLTIKDVLDGRINSHGST